MRTIFFLAFLSLIFISCGNDSGKEKAGAKDSTSQSSNAYHFEKHDDIRIFMDDLAAAIEAGDKATVARMTAFPFSDSWPQFITGNNPDSAKKITGLESKDSTEFVSKYDEVFRPQLVSAIKNKTYRGFEKNEHVPDIIEEGEYVVLGKDTDDTRQYGLAIKKINGIYKIYRMAFSS